MLGFNAISSTAQAVEILMVNLQALNSLSKWKVVMLKVRYQGSELSMGTSY